MLLRLEECLKILIDTNRLPEASLFARTYLPSKVSQVVQLWKESFGKQNEKAAQALADPASYENLFPGFKNSLKAEQYLKQTRNDNLNASEYSNLTVIIILLILFIFGFIFILFILFHNISSQLYYVNQYKKCLKLRKIINLSIKS